MNKNSVIKNCQQLVAIMYEIQYGTIYDLMVRDRDPVLKPAPRIVRDVMLGKRETKRFLKSREDYVLKAQHEELIEYFYELGDGKIERIEVQAGLPFRIRVAAAT